jgi:hypothetical protein
VKAYLYFDVLKGFIEMLGNGFIDSFAKRSLFTNVF